MNVEHLNHRFASGKRKLQVLCDVSLSVGASELVAVQGESGCGKTTMLLACGAMLRPTNGCVRIEQQVIYRLPASARSQFRASHIGFLFQTLQLVPYLNVLDNIRLVQGVSTETAMQWLNRMGLDNRLHHKPESLSHGQRQRVALVRALVHRPTLVIADEPTGNLDSKNTRLVFETLRKFADEGGAVLIATHDSTIEEFADQMLCIEAGSMSAAKART